MTPLVTPVTLSKGAWHFSLVFGCDIPTYYPSYLIESFSKGTWHCFCLFFGCNNPTYYLSYFEQGGFTFLLCLWVWHPHLLPKLPDWVVCVCPWFLVLEKTNNILIKIFRLLPLSIHVNIYNLSIGHKWSECKVDPCSKTIPYTTFEANNANKLL